jgi:hypothetical protein
MIEKKMLDEIARKSGVQDTKQSLLSEVNRQSRERRFINTVPWLYIFCNLLSFVINVFLCFVCLLLITVIVLYLVYH